MSHPRIAQCHPYLSRRVHGFRLGSRWTPVSFRSFAERRCLIAYLCMIERRMLMHLKLPLHQPKFPSQRLLVPNNFDPILLRLLFNLHLEDRKTQARLSSVFPKTSASWLSLSNRTFSASEYL